MATTIKLKSGSGAPLAGDLVAAEPAFDLTNKRLYTEDSGGTVIEVGTNPTSLTTGTFTSTGIDDNATSTAITIDASENVGIGTASPSNQLHLNTTAASNVIQLTNSATGTGAGDGMQIVTSSLEMQLRNREAGPTTFYTSNTERMRIDSSGKIGINNSAPFNKLDIKSSPTTALASAESQLALRNNNGRATYVTFDNSADLTIYNTAAGDASGGNTVFHQTSGEAMRIDSSGNVGIGTTSPSALLDLVGGAASPLVLELNTANSNCDITMQSASTSSVTRLRNGTNDFQVHTNGTERMRINSSGNVGIGTTSPDAPIEISRSDAGIIQYITNTGSDQAYTAYGNSDNPAWSQDFLTPGGLLVGLDSNETGIIYQGGNYALRFGTNNAERARIDSSGNVGIGTTSPNTKLDVIGSTTNGSGVVDTLRLRNTGTTVNDGPRLQFTAGSSTQGAAIGSQGDSLNSAALLFYAGGNTERMRIDSSGTINIGTTAAGGGSGNVGVGFTQIGRTISNCDGDWNYEIFGAQGNRIRFFTSAGGGTQVGSITVTTSTTAYNTSSDERLKENIVDAPAGNIDDIRVRSFDWKADRSHQTYGMVAQELVDVAPEAVTQGNTEDDLWSVDYSKLVPMMIKEIQDLKAEVAALKGA